MLKLQWLVKSLVGDLNVHRYYNDGVKKGGNVSKKYLIALLVLIVGASSFFLYQSYRGPKAIAQREISKVVAEANSQLQTAGVLGDIRDVLIKDEIKRISWDALPGDVQSNLSRSGYSRADAVSIMSVNASAVTKASSITLAAANMISSISGLIFGSQGSKQELTDAAALYLTQQGISAAGGEELSAVTGAITDTGELVVSASKVLRKAKEAVSVPMLAATASAWLLGREMDYINSRVDKGLAQMWTLNPLSTRLQLYLVFINTKGKGEWVDKMGVLYYYTNRQGQNIKYYTALTGSKLVVKKK